nr:unnamed protein product [Callosobruchus chinensis]CAH7719788.1 unnamed protein product [Callosobruchus chinensis]CAH7730911.1 unnamed protein product [Callosobruchus chinensis]
MLDLIISKTNCIITKDCSPLIIEDPYHPALSIELKNVYVRHVPVNSASSYKRYNFRKASYVTLYEDLVSTNWDFMQNINDSTQALQCFYDKLYVILDTHVPLYVSFKHRYPVWYSSEIIRLVKSKAKLHKKYNYWKRFCLPRFQPSSGNVKIQNKGSI